MKSEKFEKVGIVILAAGRSKRLGRPKQLLEYEHKSLLQKTIDASIKIPKSPVILILGAFYDKIVQNIDTGRVTVVRNKKWQQGMSSSIKLGVNSLLSINEKIENVLFLVCDQPYLSSDILEKLISNHIMSSSLITASKYRGKFGVPAIFSRPFFSELLALEGDKGAKKIIQRNIKVVSSVEFDLGQFDIDKEEDYQALLDREP